MQQTVSKSSFGTLLREFRLAAGLSQEALAERASMSADGVGALERGVNKAPQRETLALLIEALDLQPDQRHAIEAAASRSARPRNVAARAARKHNLPRRVTAFYGRERELVEVERLVERTHLVTLIGAGGVGKTRLAIEAAYRLLEGSLDEVWFVELAPARDPRDVTAAIAATAGVRERSEQPLIDEIVQALGRKEVLIVLDNCEHLVAAAAAAVEAISAGAPNARILATSRQPLQVPGEQTYRVASLDARASVDLFVDVAKRADPSFSLDVTERPIVERICARLDGIALAIELAAARVHVLALLQVEELLSERFEMLTGGGHLARHQTMRALVDWSYDLLSEEERSLFDRLGVFAAEFSLDAAVAVCSGEGIEESRVLALLGSLIDKSLLTSERRGKTRRFRLLETMRAYALEKLGDRIDALNRRHAEYFLQFVEKQQPSAPGWPEALAIEYDNVRRALDWCVDDCGDVSLGVRLLWGLREYVLLRGFGADVARRVERSLACRDELPVPLQAKAWEMLTSMRGTLLLPAPSLAAATQALQLYEKLGDEAGMARVLRGRGIAHLRSGLLTQADEDLQRSLELGERAGDRRELMRTLGSVAVSLQMTGRFDEARRKTLEVLEMARDERDERLVWVTLVNLAEIEFAMGEVEAAVAHSEELLASTMARTNVRMRANVRSNLAAYLLALHREGEAQSAARAAVFDARDAGDPGVIACALGHLAALLAQRDPADGARLLGYVEGIFAGVYKREGTERYTYELLVKTLHRTLTDDEIAALEREGAAMSEAHAIRLATRSRGTISIARTSC